jgi:prepilin-type N-terminal cleavage/methylation domain-containing protein
MISTTRIRTAFTLVELLVVIGIMAVLLALAVMIIPGVTDGQNNTRAATQLQQWIEIAKQRAARDRVPRGIRLLYNTVPIVVPGAAPTDNQFLQATRVVKLEYIEQPDPYTLGSAVVTVAPGVQKTMQSMATITPTAQQVSFSNNDRTLTGGLGSQGLQPVQSGDYLELAGVLYRIATVNGPTTLTLNTAVPASMLNSSTSNYRIIRQPRPIGDDPMDMPEDIIIDVMPRYIGSTPPAKGAQWTPGPYDLFSSVDIFGIPSTFSPDMPLDILFAPDGRVISTVGNNLAAKDKIILWVRYVDPSNVDMPNGFNGFASKDISGNFNPRFGNPNPGNPAGIPDNPANQPPWGKNDPTLVIIYPRTGLVTAQPVDTDWTSPYTFTSSGR